MAHILDYESPKDDQGPPEHDLATTTYGRICQQFVEGFGVRPSEPWAGHGAKESLIPCGSWEMVFRYVYMRDPNRRSNEEGACAYVRVQATHDLSFSIHPVGILDQLKEVVGVHDIQIGEPLFDANYTVQSNQPELVRKLLHNPTILAGMRAAPYGQLTLGAGLLIDGFSRVGHRCPGEAVLQYSPVATSLDGLLIQHAFMAQVLEELCALNTITRTSPS